MWLLSGLGASAVAGPADLVPIIVDDLDGLAVAGGLPPGTLEWANSVAAAFGAVGGHLTGRPLPASATGVAMTVRLPEVMAAAYGSSVKMTPAPPVAFGGGYLHADVGAPGDPELLESCLASLPAGAGAEAAAIEAQNWRLAVCDYRARGAFDGSHPVSVALKGPAGRSGRGLRVVDLTTMWAGPLAVWLLSLVGAHVTRVEPSFRPDGFRALDGRGIHPGGVQCEPGRDSAMFNALHPGGGDVVDLDLRAPGDRCAFEELVAGADLVVDSFSPRVMANFGYSELPGATRASVTAFGPGRRAAWVGYGTGVHAALGLGDDLRGHWRAPMVSYPDPLAGMVLALGSAAAVAGRRCGRRPSHVATSLAASVAPLLTFPPAPWSEAKDLGPELLARAADVGLMERRPVAGRQLLHPATVFISK